MSMSNENEPQKSSAPADPGPPEWLKAANASKDRARTLFPKSTIGQSPRSTIGVPSEPVAAASAPSAASPEATAPEATAPVVATTSPANTASPATTAEASHPLLPYTAPLTPSDSNGAVPEDAAPAIPTPPFQPATAATSNPSVTPATSNPFATPAPNNPYAAPASANRYAAPASANPYATASASNPYATPAPGSSALAGKGLSVTSLILGCIGVVLTIVWLGFFPALAAVITGHMAQRRQPAAKGFWLTGLVTGYLGLVFSTILVVWIVAVFVQSYMAIGAGQ